jgi:hypothetical protein
MGGTVTHGEMITNFMELSPSWEAANCATTQELPAFYGTRRFITVFTRALHWFLSWARSIQSIQSHSVFVKLILTLFTHLLLGLPSGLVTSGFPTNILYVYAFLLHSSCYMRSTSHHPWLDRSNYGEEYKLRSSSLCNDLQSPVTSSVFGPNILLSILFGEMRNAYESEALREETACVEGGMILECKFVGWIQMGPYRAHWEILMNAGRILWVQ